MQFYYTVSAGDLREYMPAVPVLLVASSWSRVNFRVPHFPPQIVEKGADSGGFVATFKWGGYRYTPAQYVEWLVTWAPQWAATMDYCCEDEITNGKPGVVRERQETTTKSAKHFWSRYRLAPWAWTPTVQGWEPEDYRRHALALRPLIDDMREEYTRRGLLHHWRVGVGTLCRRASGDTIHRILDAVIDVLPDTPLHLWGVKLDLLKGRTALPAQVRSADSAAWNRLFHAAIEEWRADGRSERRWGYEVAMPRYQASIRAALASPKQMRLPVGA